MKEEQLELDLPEPFQVDENQAEQLEAASTELAEVNNLGDSTATDMVFVQESEKERVSWSRRTFLFGLWLSGVVVTGAAGSALYDAAKKYTTDQRTGADIFDNVFGDELDDGFIEFVERNRGRATFERFERLSPNADLKTRFIVRLVRTFDEGGHASEEDLKSLIRLLKISSHTKGKVFLTDLITAELVRLGQGTWAKTFIKKLAPIVRSERERLLYMEKIFSTHYTSLAPADYLSPKKWEFDRGLDLFNDTVGSAIGMKLAPKEDSYRITNLPDLSRKSVDEFARELKAPGFYSLFWALQHAGASADSVGLKEIAEIQYKMLQMFAAPRLELNRAVWNSLFISAMQFHRQNETLLRDKFVSASLDLAFWGSNIRTTLNGRLNRYDVIPICWLLFVNTIPELRSRIRLPDEFTLAPIVRGRENVKAQRVRAAVDLVRKNAREGATRDEALRDYLTGDPNALGVYLSSFDSIRQGLQQM